MAIVEVEQEDLLAPIEAPTCVTALGVRGREHGNEHAKIMSCAWHVVGLVASVQSIV